MSTNKNPSQVTLLVIFFICCLAATYVFASEKAIKIAKIFVGKVPVKAELVESYEDQARGLMFRRSLPEDEGMLFVYNDEAPRSFWMKNTFIPLSIGFFNKKQELIDIQEMVPVKSEMQINLPVYKSKSPAMFALEVNSNWFARHKIKLGEKLKLKK